MVTQVKKHYWKCSYCNHIEHKEEEVLCWKCGGKGEMLYQGEGWFPAEPMPCPSRWDVFKETINLWWKKYAGDPEDPDSLGINLLNVVFWSIFLATFLALLVIFE